jgi:hypothetical protein
MMRRKATHAALLTLLSSALAAQERTPFPVKIHGFVMGNLAARSSGDRVPGGEGGVFVLGEERLRLDVSGAAKTGRTFFLIKGDVFHDAVINRADGDLREAYVGYHSGPIDVRVGRQILTWGVGDLFFINDVFPKDWESFFSGRPMEYLKRGVDAVRFQYSSEALNVDLVTTPFFRSDALPSPKRFFLYNPFRRPPQQRETKPPAQAENTEVALRLYRRLAGLDVSVYGYRGFWRTPGMRPETTDGALGILRFYPRLVLWGLSAQRNWLEGVLSVEAGRYDSRDDPGGADPAIPNSHWRLLAGYQRQLARELTANFQGYTEIMSRYDAYRQFLPRGTPVQDRVRGVFSVRLTQFWGYQNWKFAVFGAYSPTDEDSFFQPEISHRLSDKVSVGLGANFFGGRRYDSFFGQMRRDDNVYVTARFDF